MGYALVWIGSAAAVACAVVFSELTAQRDSSAWLCVVGFFLSAAAVFCGDRIVQAQIEAELGESCES